MKPATLNVRLEPELKATVDNILDKIGLTPTDAVTVLYRQIAMRGGLPFDVCIPNAETLAAMAELDAGGGRSVRGTGREVVDAILAE